MTWRKWLVRSLVFSVLGVIVLVALLYEAWTNPSAMRRTVHAKLGTVFTGTLIEETNVGPYPAVVPQLAGTAWITGFAQYVVDPTDPFPEGFTIADIW